MRLWARALVAALLPLAAGLASPSGALADPSGPSAGQVQRAAQQARERAAAVGAAEARLAVADARLAEVGAAAERLVEAYNGARVALQLARASAARADAAARAADAEVAAQRAQMGRLAAATYRAGGGLTMVGALLQSSGPASFLQRAGAVQQLSRHQGDQLGRLRAAEVTQRLAQAAARATVADLSAAEEKARAARARAAAAVVTQQQQVAELSAEREQLALAAAAARQRAGQLAAARAAYLQAVEERRAKEAAQARARELAAQQERDRASGGVDPAPLDPPSGEQPQGRSTAAQGRQALAYAKRQLGKPYEWAASGPDSFDCSGLTMMAWRNAGISLFHYSAAQYDQGVHVARALLRPGDLVFYADDTGNPSTIHHVGIYAGNGQMINAPQTGDVVKYAPVDRADYIGATRP